MGIDPALKMLSKNPQKRIGKYLLREAFREGNYLPEAILMREKAAFSDAVGHRSVDFLKEMAESKYSDSDFERQRSLFTHATPRTKEELLYRELFESFFPNRGTLIPSLWLPNQSWENCNVTDPSARVLPNYGTSGT